MAGELVGWDKGLGYARGPPGGRFREMRRLMRGFVGQGVWKDMGREVGGLGKAVVDGNVR